MFRGLCWKVVLQGTASRAPQGSGVVRARVGSSHETDPHPQPGRTGIAPQPGQTGPRDPSTLASFSPSSLFTTLSCVESAWQRESAALRSPAAQERGSRRWHNPPPLPAPECQREMQRAPRLGQNMQSMALSTARLGPNARRAAPLQLPGARSCRTAVLPAPGGEGRPPRMPTGPTHLIPQQHEDDVLLRVLVDLRQPRLGGDKQKRAPVRTGLGAGSLMG